MKTTVAIAMICLLSVAKAKAEDIQVRIENLAISETADKLKISYMAVIDKKAVKNSHTMVFAPVITDGNYRQSLIPVVVRGKRAKTSTQRQQWVSGVTYGFENARYTENGKNVYMTIAVERQPWMDNAELILESVDGGCCTYTRNNDVVLSHDVITNKGQMQAVLQQTELQLQQTGVEPLATAAAVADAKQEGSALENILGDAFPFVSPASEFDPAAPYKVYDDEREGALTVYFRGAHRYIDPAYRGNAATLARLTSVINMIQAAGSSRVKHILVAGYSSPDGTLASNDRLAFERGVSVKQYIMRHTGIEDSKIMVHNGSIDYRGLRMMVEKSELPEKSQVIDIIDNTPIWDHARQVGRLGQLMRLNGGNTYRRMLRDYFPSLRAGAFIKVYYEDE